MFFSTPGPATIMGLQGFVCHRKGYRGLPLWGGPVEKLGRLKYIDGCSDTLLLAAPIKGDPCLNYLYIPPGVNQTAHTHPSVRVGCIIDGEGYCRLENRTIESEFPGKSSCCQRTSFHSFHTSGQAAPDNRLSPNSDFGPTDEVHPMINRTIVDNKSRRRRQQIPHSDYFRVGGIDLSVRLCIRLVSGASRHSPNPVGGRSAFAGNCSTRRLALNQASRGEPSFEQFWIPR